MFSLHLPPTLARGTSCCSRVNKSPPKAIAAAAPSVTAKPASQPSLHARRVRAMFIPLVGTAAPEWSLRAAEREHFAFHQMQWLGGDAHRLLLLRSGWVPAVAGWIASKAVYCDRPSSEKCAGCGQRQHSVCKLPARTALMPPMMVWHLAKALGTDRVPRPNASASMTAVVAPQDAPPPGSSLGLSPAQGMAQPLSRSGADDPSQLVGLEDYVNNRL